MQHPKYHERFGFRSRYVAFLPDDELAYAEVLRNAFPRCIFLDRNVAADPSGHKPAIVAKKSIADCKTNDIAIYLDEREFVPRQMRSYDVWFIDSPTRPAGRWVRSATPQNHDENKPTPPQLPTSNIDFLVLLDNKEQVRLAEKAIRLLNKVTSRDVVCLRYPSREPFFPKWAVPHVGHHAMAWARASKDRWLAMKVRPPKDGETAGFGYRPIEEDEK